MKKSIFLFLLCFGLIGCIRSPVYADEINDSNAVEESAETAQDTILDFSSAAKLGDATIKAVPIVPTPEDPSGTWESVFQPVLQRFAHFVPTVKPGSQILASGFESNSNTSIVTQMIHVIAGIAGFTVGLVFLYWGIRKVTRAIMSAFKHGRLRI